MTGDFRCGFIAVVGRPNVGKSTLTNRMVGVKVSITSRKAQTTRHRIHGILTTPLAQLIFVDTPGFQRQHVNALNRAMNRAVTTALADVDAVILVVEAGRWGSGEREIAELLPQGTPVVLAINKIDRLADRGQLLPFIDAVSREHDFAAIVPVSAERGDGVERLIGELGQRLPLGAPVFLKLDRGEASGLWVAQDTGGAIKGANRFDTFWGAGEEARLIAGGMSARGDALLLLPKGTIKRLTGK